MKVKHSFLQEMSQPIINVQNNGPINLLLGKFGTSSQMEIKAMFIVCSIAIDNEECFRIQTLSFGSKCHSNCRLCTKPTSEFYKFSTLEQIFNIEGSSTLSTIEVLDAYNKIESTLYPIRDSIEDNRIGTSAKLVWWKKTLFNKKYYPVGKKILKLKDREKSLLLEAKSRNVKAIQNGVHDNVISPFFTRGGLQETIIPMGLVYASDKLHTFEKGMLEFTFRYGSIIIFLYGRKVPDNFGRNVAIVDNNIQNFDIYQPLSSWGTKPQKTSCWYFK